jgi:hypothetical protein
MSYLTEPVEVLRRELTAALEGEGFAYNSLRMTWTEYLATALGQSTAYRFKSEGQLLTELDAAYGGSLSYLRASIPHLLDDVAANIGAGGGGGGGDERVTDTAEERVTDDGETRVTDT